MRNRTRGACGNWVAVYTICHSRPNMLELPPPDSISWLRSTITTPSAMRSPRRWVPAGIALTSPSRRSAGVGPASNSRTAAASSASGPRPWTVRVTSCTVLLDAWARMKYTDTLASGGCAHRHAAATASSAMQNATTYRRVRLAIVCYVSAPIIFANSRSVRTRTPSFVARSIVAAASPPAPSRSVFFDTVELIIAPWSLASDDQLDRVEKDRSAGRRGRSGIEAAPGPETGSARPHGTRIREDDRGGDVADDGQPHTPVCRRVLHRAARGRRRVAVGAASGGQGLGVLHPRPGVQQHGARRDPHGPGARTGSAAGRRGARVACRPYAAGP